MSMIWLRGPDMRDQLNRMTETIMKKVMQLTVGSQGIDSVIDEQDEREGTETPADIRAIIGKTLISGDYKLSFTNAHHLEFLKEMKGFANLFHGQYWRVFVNNTKETFVTSDSPIAIYLPPPQGSYGPTFLERTHCFALSPRICIEAVYPDQQTGKKLRRTTLFPGMEGKVVDLNRAIGSRARRYIYAQDRRPLEALLQHLRPRAKT